MLKQTTLSALAVTSVLGSISVASGATLQGVLSGGLNGHAAVARPVVGTATGKPSAGIPQKVPDTHAVEERTWVPLDDGKAPGATAEIVLDRKSSGPQRSVFDLHIHGFWVTDKQGPDGRTYQHVEIPGLGSHNQQGAPDLPAYRFRLAVPVKGDGARLRAEIMDTREFQDFLIWPQTVSEIDHEEGNPEKFVIDKRVYGTSKPWPGDIGVRNYKIGQSLRSVPTVDGETWPVSWNPETSEMQIATQVRYIVDHPGEPQKYDAMTRERGRLAERGYINWAAVAVNFPINALFYSSSYLIIYPDASYADEVRPLADQKRARGFRVTEKTVDAIGSTCSDIRNAINTWEASVPASHDAYALLIGDTDVIPHCTSPTGDQTDDLYASTDGDDLNEEIFLGRLSVDDEADLANQITRILSYEDNPTLFCCYNQAGLWAHKENAPGKYEGAHETVRTNSYSVPPTFTTYYGSQTGVSDSDIVNHVNSGLGLLAYRGHGSSSSTATGWNQSSEYFNNSDVGTLANPIARAPVVWSFACTNSKLDVDDSIAEQWMEQGEAGAVSYYGATRTSYTSQNHVLDEWMFRAVYDEGLVTQSHAIQRGEDQMATLSAADNAWMYLLLGDPDLQIRRRNPVNLTLRIPEEIRMCKLCELELLVTDDKGTPIPDALVGLWKPGKAAGPGLQGEVFVNRYADNNGKVKLPVSLPTTGRLYYAVEDGRGNATFNAVEVVR